MVVAEAMEGRPLHNHMSERRYQANSSMARYVPDGHYVPHFLMERHFVPGPFPVMNAGPRYMPGLFPPINPGLRYPPGPVLRGRGWGNMGPPVLPPPPPPFMRRMPYPPLRARLPMGPNVPYRRYFRGRKRSNKAKQAQPAPPKVPEESFLHDMEQPWITEEIRVEHEKKLQLIKLARETRCDHAWSMFKVQRDKCHAMVRAARDEYTSAHPEIAEPKKDESTENAGL